MAADRQARQAREGDAGSGMSETRRLRAAVPTPERYVDAREVVELPNAKPGTLQSAFHVNGPAPPKRPGPGNGGSSSDATPTLLTVAEAARL
jgi:hypothetical protein